MGKKRIYTVDSFPKEFFDIWNLAITGQLKMPVESKGFGTNMKQRLYTFRRVLPPELNATFYQTDLKVQEEKGEWFLVAYIPEWKKAVREQVQQNPEVELPKEVEELLGTLTFSKEEKDVMDESLQKLGYGTQTKE